MANSPPPSVGGDWGANVVLSKLGYFMAAAVALGHERYKGNVVDHPATMDLAFNVGKVILNFGQIEMLLIELAEIVSRDPESYQKALSLQFRDRVALVRNLTEASHLPQELRQQLLTELTRVEELAKLRNDLAHNPCILVWKDGSDRSGPPDAIGIPLMRTLRGKVTREVQTVSIDAVKRAVDEINEGAVRLSKVREAVRAALK